jgi:hypothetical protein
VKGGKVFPETCVLYIDYMYVRFFVVFRNLEIFWKCHYYIDCVCGVTPCNLVCGYRYFVKCAASINRVEVSHFWGRYNLYRKEAEGNGIRTINISKSKETVQ